MNGLEQNINRMFFYQYVGKKFIAYDSVYHMDEKVLDLVKLNQIMVDNVNVAIVSDDKSLGFEGVQEVLSKNGEIITKDSKNFQIIDFDVNRVLVKTSFPQRKFLVYNDAYYSPWQVFVNGKKAKLHRANFAFKGVWVPQGDALILFRYGQVWQYVLNWFVLSVFWGIFIYLVYCLYKEESDETPA